MKSIGRLLSVFVLLFSAVVLSGQDKSGKPEIGIIAGGETSFWRTFCRGTEAGAVDFGFAVRRPSVTPDTSYLQVKSVQDMMKGNRVKAFIISPLDSRSLVRPLKDAESQGVKSVIVGNKLKLSTYLSFISVDNYAAGKLCAKKMGLLLNGSGKVVVVPFSTENDATLQREKGFIDELKASWPGITVFQTIQYAGPDYQQATYATASVLTQYSFADGFFCSEELTSHCMLNALAARKIATNKKLIGYGINDALFNGLKAGKVDALALSDPYKMGYESVKFVAMSTKGEAVKNKVEYPVVMVDKGNLDKENIKQLITKQLPDAFKAVPFSPVPEAAAPVKATAAPTTTITTGSTTVVTVPPAIVPPTVVIVGPDSRKPHHKDKDKSDKPQSKEQEKKTTPPAQSAPATKPAAPAIQPTTAPVAPATVPTAKSAAPVTQPTTAPAVQPKVTTIPAGTPSTQPKTKTIPAGTPSTQPKTKTIPAGTSSTQPTATTVIKTTTVPVKEKVSDAASTEQPVVKREVKRKGFFLPVKNDSDKQSDTTAQPATTTQPVTTPRDRK